MIWDSFGAGGEVLPKSSFWLIWLVKWHSTVSVDNIPTTGVHNIMMFLLCEATAELQNLKSLSYWTLIDTNYFVILFMLDDKLLEIIFHGMHNT